MRSITFFTSLLVFAFIGYHLRSAWQHRAARAHDRARLLGKLRQGYDKAHRMADTVTHQTSDVFWAYVDQLEQLAHDLGLAELFPCAEIRQKAIRAMPGPRAVEV